MGEGPPEDGAGRRIPALAWPAALAPAALLLALFAAGCALLSDGSASAVGGPTVPKHFYRCARTAGIAPHFDSRYRALGHGFLGGFRIPVGAHHRRAVVVSIYGSEQDASRALPHISAIVGRHRHGGATRHANVVVSHSHKVPRTAIARVLRCARAR